MRQLNERTSINFDVTVNCDIILVDALVNFQELIKAYETGWGRGWYRENVSGKRNFWSSVEVLKKGKIK